jgi:SAM-dependent methyltransferase
MSLRAASSRPSRTLPASSCAISAPITRPPKQGAVSPGRILFIDHADTEAIKRKYAAEPSVNQDTIVEVDAVWSSQTLQECIGGRKKVDYVLASHVIEHVSNLIAWLSEIRSILRPNGSLRLAIPDKRYKRYTFDYLRSESRISDVLEAYLLKARAPLPRFILERQTFARKVDCGAAWDGPVDSTLLEPMGTVRSGLELAHDAIANGVYHDTHCWMFTPLSFAELCRDVAELDLMNFSCQIVFETPCNKFEFYVHLFPSDDKEAISESWQKMRAGQLLRSPSYQKSAKDLLDLNALLRAEARIVVDRL